MREGFHDDLKQLNGRLAAMAEAAAEAMRRATRALLAVDLPLAEQVLSGDADLDDLRATCEDEAYSLLALQAPVAGDLRAVLAVVYCAEKLERMGDLAAHVAGTARRGHPEPTVSADLEPVFAELGEVTSAMADRLADLVRGDARGGYAELSRADERVDALHARVMATVTSPDWTHDQRIAVALSLLTRFYERFADQAVSVAKRLEFAATGDLPG
ncbi:phosphate signaling complex PhoU family protein [Amycolatopsis echigonensis]|uniref:Phosphate-specific transport system accessory protein PhoU n=1 Tax=Amycolatopsis echigonensis TaxID=2576905 RepID=A0A8E1T374_9PSEU|nr:PhoU domain-containing protein [Amycolatopsis echigonensis]MBB2497568.1 phosphate transport system regulatory protein PhoU [Amycolatopsis echigonensis]